MKKLIICSLVMCLVGTLSVTAEEDTTRPWLMTASHRMGRGFCNLITAGVELPRAMWYNHTRLPFVGAIPGAVDGAFLTTARALSGMTDLMALGFTDPGIYNETYTQYVWQSPWVSEDEIELDAMVNRAGRGAVNVLAGWLEIPRNVWNHNVALPYVGLFPGVIDGAALTATRTVGGAADLATLGFINPGIYGPAFTECISDAPWTGLSECEE